MEQVRVLLAIALSFLVFFLWNMFALDPETPKPAPQATADSPGKNANGQEGSSSAAPTEVPAPKSLAQPYPEPAGPRVAESQARDLHIDTPLYRVTLSEAGGVITSCKLHQYRETADPGSAAKEIVPEGVTGQGEIFMSDGGIVGLEGAAFRADAENTEIEAVSGPQTVVLRWLSSDGIEVQRHFTFSPDSYVIEMQTVIRNGSSATLTGSMGVKMQGIRSNKKATYGFEGPSGFIDGSLVQVEPKEIGKSGRTTGEISWVAMEEQYFISAVVPTEDVVGTMELHESEGGLISNRLIFPENVITSGSEARNDYLLFLGPKSLDILTGVHHHLNKAVNFGMFDIIAKPCLWLMKWIYGFIPNYGIAIILMTLLTKVILWPLGNKSYKSMSEMKRIQPLMAEIREKYKHDKKQMNQEMMGLYKTYKINPLGGCLPMVLQIPVFFALYRMLYQAIELRHAPFLFWINDLSAPDRLFHFDFTIPFMQPPYGIPVLTIIMGGTMFLQQKMSPPPGDPTQAKMMMLMPIVFTVIFVNFSSGLVLYWLVNNLVSIGQQYYIQKKMA